MHWPRTLDSGVGKKLDRQIKIWQTGGHEARLFMHTSRYASPLELVPAEVIPYEPAGTLRTEFNRIAAAKRLLQAVQNYNPDVIYLRLAMYVYPVHLLANIAPLIGEANTNDLTQHEGLGKVYALYNRLTRGILLRRLHGLVAVSHELAESSAFTTYRKPTSVIANGIDLENFEPLPAPANSTPRLAFIGNPGYPWHGVDKLVELAGLLPDVQLDVIGYEELPGSDELPENLKLHGYLPEAEYKRILAGADAAISSLGLHRIGLEEASPLKSRECLAFGLPLILAYVDTNLHNLETDFLLRIPNKEDNIQSHGQAIRDFAYRMRGRRVDRSLITSIDQVAKEKERIRFFEEILSSRR
jgi:glycosyltransferase involved in cell wall biosynthesis